MDIDKIDFNTSLDVQELTLLMNVQNKMNNDIKYNMTNEEKINFLEYVNKLVTKVKEEVLDIQFLVENFNNVINSQM